MRYTFQGKFLEITPSLQRYIKDKFQALSRIFKKEDVSLEVEVERETRHYKKGLVFLAKAILDVKAKNPLFAEAESYDARSAVDIVRDVLFTEARKFKEKRAVRRREGERRLKRLMKGL